MTRTFVRPLLAALTLVVLPAVAPAQAGAAALGGAYPVALAQVADDGLLDATGFFGPDAVAAARRKIRAIRREYRCAVFIETVHQPPLSGRSRAHSWNAYIADTYFHEWAGERAQEFGVEGIYVLICMKPWHVAAVVRPERFDAEFTAQDRAGIERLIRQKVRSPDETLLTAVDHIRDDLEARRGPQPPSASFAVVGVFVGGSVGVWLLLSLVRLRWHKPEPFSFTPGHQTARLTACLLAGMFGSPATHWITDRLYPKGATGSAADILLPEVVAETPPVPEPSDEGMELLHEEGQEIEQGS